MKNFLKYVSFTKNETRVVLFVLAVLTAGFSIKYYKQVIENNSGASYDYRSSDSVFRERTINAKKRQPNHLNNDSSTSDDSLIKSLQASDDSLISKRELSPDNNSSFAATELFNINTAGKSELTELPGIGDAIADRIIAYRKIKEFKKIEDLMNVKGIGRKKFEKLKNNITVK